MLLDKEVWSVSRRVDKVDIPALRLHGMARVGGEVFGTHVLTAYPACLACPAAFLVRPLSFLAVSLAIIALDPALDGLAHTLHARRPSTNAGRQTLCSCAPGSDWTWQPRSVVAALDQALLRAADVNLSGMYALGP
jgi:hypothetical protein